MLILDRQKGWHYLTTKHKKIKTATSTVGRKLTKAEREYTINHFFAGENANQIAEELNAPVAIIEAELSGLQRPPQTQYEIKPQHSAETIRAAFDQEAKRKGCTIMTENASMLIDDNREAGVYADPNKGFNPDYMQIINPEKRFE
jgi:hypothetical protein